ncbi:hypothetical protein TNCV_4910471 [Trichonephila clavipes]|nr:hypothetical protein TNCV_4910471 [Trichonephila clavipes]
MGSTGLDILSKLAGLHQRKQVCLQWIPLHVVLPRNEAADELTAKSPGLSVQCRSSRFHQTALSRFRINHLPSMTCAGGKVLLYLSLPSPCFSCSSSGLLGYFPVTVVWRARPGV